MRRDPLRLHAGSLALAAFLMLKGVHGPSEVFAHHEQSTTEMNVISAPPDSAFFLWNPQ